MHDGILVYVGILHSGCRNPSLGLATQAKRVTRVRAKISVKECEDEDSHSQVGSHFGSWSPGGLPNLQRVIEEVKTLAVRRFFISLEIY
jgi:predicted aconitase